MADATDRASSAAIVYLALPGLVFSLGWLEIVPGLLLAALLSMAMLPLFRLTYPVECSRQQPVVLVWLACLAAAWASLGGTGHFVFANPDWHTRDAVYADLIFSRWPPAYQQYEESTLILRSAIGFFLAPAALAKAIGADLARWILYAWCALGSFLFLVLLPLPHRPGVRLVMLCLAVIGFSGMDYPAILVVHEQTPVFPLPLEWWRPWTYTSLTGQLFWAPNHALPLWIGTALILRHRNSKLLGGLLLILLPVALVWTPFAVGLLPWAVWALWQRGKPFAANPHALSPVQWIGGLILGALMIAYYSRPGIEAASFTLGSAGSAGPAATWSYLDAGIAYMQFVGFEFGILALLLRPAITAHRQMLGLALILLLLLPLIRLGPSNDLMLRISTPCLIVLLLLVIAEFSKRSTNPQWSWRTVGLVAVLAAGAVTPGFEIARAFLWKRTPPNYGQTLVEAQRGYLAPHYLGKLDLPLLKILFKAPEQVTSRKQSLPPEK